MIVSDLAATHYPCPQHPPEVSKRASVIVPTYQRHECLVNTIEYVLAALGPEDELLVVDQKPNHPAEVDRRLIEFSARPNIKYLIVDDAASSTMARNVGILHARGEFLVFLDDDIECEPDLIDNHVAYFENPQVAGVAGHVTDEKMGHFYPKGEIPPWAPGGNSSFRRSAALQVGGFDTNLIGNFTFDDIEFSGRIVRDVGKLINGRKCHVNHLAVRSGGCSNRGLDGQLKSEIKNYFYYIHNAFYCALNGMRWAIAAKFILSWNRPPIKYLIQPRFLYGTYFKALLTAIKTRYSGQRPPFWPKVMIREINPSSNPDSVLMDCAPSSSNG